jgi:myo-inositol-hexaphosphate 3-phosphohydrolase
LGIEENFQNFSFYPNPAKSEISIATSEYSDIQLIDLSGKIIDSFSVQSFKKVDLKYLERGVYLLNISSKSGRSSRKLILE